MSDGQRPPAAVPPTEGLRVDTSDGQQNIQRPDQTWTEIGQPIDPSPRNVITAPSSPATSYTTDRETVLRSGTATVAETHLIRSTGSQSQSFTEEHWSSEITSFIAAAPPKFIQVIKAYRIMSSDTPTLVVEVASDPPAIFEWFCNDRPVLQDRRRFQARHGINITTLTVKQPEQGVYKCTARNPAGVSTSYGYITVNFENRYSEWSVQSQQMSESMASMTRSQSGERSITYNTAPRFITQVPNLTVQPGNEVIIDVEVDANPFARFGWFVNGKEYRDSTRNVEIYYPKENRCVAKFKLPVAGEYKVVASNAHGSAMSSGYVEILQVNPPRQTRPPLAPGEHISRSVMSSSSHPAAPVQESVQEPVTTHQTINLYEVNYAQRSSSVPRGVRHLERHVEVARHSPDRQTSVDAERRRAAASDTTLIHDLEAVGEYAQAPRFITAFPESLHVAHHERLVLSADVSAIPTAEFRWTIDDVDVKSEQNIAVLNEQNKSTLVVQPPIRKGRYMVEATNRVGRDSIAMGIHHDGPDITQSAVTVTSARNSEQMSPASSRSSKETVKEASVDESMLPLSPHITTPLPGRMHLRSNEELVLEIGVVCAFPCTFKWFENNFELRNTNKIHIEEWSSGSSIKIDEPKDALYKVEIWSESAYETSMCKVTTDSLRLTTDWRGKSEGAIDTTKRMMFQLGKKSGSYPKKTLPIAPKIVELPTEAMRLAPGTPIKVICRVDAIPEADFKWFFNNFELKHGVNNVAITRIGDNESELSMPEPPHGKFEVVARNELGSDSKSFKVIHVYGDSPPREIPKISKDIELHRNEHGEIELRVIMIAKKPLNFRWYLNGKEVGNDDHVKIIILENETRMILRRKLEKDTEIRVEGKNSDGKCETIMRVEETVDWMDIDDHSQLENLTRSTEMWRRESPIHEGSFEMVPLDLPEECAPKIVEPLHSATFIDGQPMVLRCKIHAVPSAGIVWSKDEISVEDWVINKDVTTQVLDGGVCELLNPECYAEDAGLYKCMATNPHGTAETAAYINVEGIPYIKDSEEASESMSASTQFEDVQIILPPKFVEPLLAEVDGIKHLGYFRLVAKVSSAAPVIITWWKDGQPLTASDKHEMYEFDDGTQILTVQRPDQNDEGVYSCKAESDHGLTNTSVGVELPRESPEIIDTAELKETDIDADMEIIPRPDEAAAALQKKKDDEAIELRKKDEEFKLLVKVADSVASELVANIFVEAVREAARRIAAESEEESEFEAIMSDTIVAPSLEVQTDTYTVIENGTVKMSAVIRGKPTPFVEWYQGENKITVTETISMAYEKGVASLTLKKAELQHAGNYYIHATNTHGTTVQSIRLSVVTKEIAEQQGIKTTEDQPLKIEVPTLQVTDSQEEPQKLILPVEQGLPQEVLPGQREKREPSEEEIRVATKFAESFVEGMMSQIFEKPFIPTQPEETIIVPVDKKIMPSEEAEVVRQPMMSYEEKVKKIEEEYELVHAANNMSPQEAVNRMMSTAMSLKEQHVSDESATIEVRQAPVHYEHLVTVLEPTVEQYKMHLNTAVSPLKFIDIDTILQKPSTSSNVDTLLKAESKKSANAEHRIVVLEGLSQNFQNAITWSLRKVKKLASDHEASSVTNVEVVRQDEENEQVLTIMDADAIIPELLQVAATASKLKLENVSVSLMKQGDTSHQQLVIEYESNTDEAADINLAHLVYEQPPEKREQQVWLRRSRFTDENDRNVTAVFVEVEANCPDQAVEIVASVSRPIDEDKFIDAETSQSLEESSSAIGNQPPKFFRQLQDNSAVVGNTAQLKCICMGTPTPDFVWRVDGDEIKPNEEYEILYEDGICILKILKVLLEDEGEYSCEAVNVNGRAMTSCFFKVIGSESSDMDEIEHYAFRKYFENAETVVSVRDSRPINEKLYAHVKMHNPHGANETVVEARERKMSQSSREQRAEVATSTTDLFFSNQRKSIGSIESYPIESDAIKLSVASSLDQRRSSNASSLSNDGPRIPDLPVKVSYKGQEIGLSVKQVDKPAITKKDGSLEKENRTITSLKIESPIMQAKPRKTQTTVKLSESSENKQIVFVEKDSSLEKSRMKEIERIAAQVELQLKSISQSYSDRKDPISERSDDAKSIEEAIFRVSEQLMLQKPITKAQAEANEELMRTTLANMILNPGRKFSIEEERRQMTEPIRLLKMKLNEIEESLMEDVEVFEISEAQSAPLPSSDNAPRPKNLRPESVTSKIKRVPSMEYMRMTPVTSNIKEQLSCLEEMINDQMGGVGANEAKKQELHDLFVKINNEINVIRAYCQKKLTPQGADAVMEVLQKVRKHVTSIVNVMHLAKKRELEAQKIIQKEQEMIEEIQHEIQEIRKERQDEIEDLANREFENKRRMQQKLEYEQMKMQAAIHRQQEEQEEMWEEMERLERERREEELRLQIQRDMLEASLPTTPVLPPKKPEMIRKPDQEIEESSKVISKQQRAEKELLQPVITPESPKLSPKMSKGQPFYIIGKKSPSIEQLDKERKIKSDESVDVLFHRASLSESITGIMVYKKPSIPGMETSTQHSSIIYTTSDETWRYSPGEEPNEGTPFIDDSEAARLTFIVDEEAEVQRSATTANFIPVAPPRKRRTISGDQVPETERELMPVPEIIETPPVPPRRTKRTRSTDTALRVKDDRELTSSPIYDEVPSSKDEPKKKGYLNEAIEALKNFNELNPWSHLKKKKKEKSNRSKSPVGDSRRKISSESSKSDPNRLETPIFLAPEKTELPKNEVNLTKMAVASCDASFWNNQRLSASETIPLSQASRINRFVPDDIPSINMTCEESEDTHTDTDSVFRGGARIFDTSSQKRTSASPRLENVDEEELIENVIVNVELTNLGSNEDIHEASIAISRESLVSEIEPKDPGSGKIDMKKQFPSNETMVLEEGQLSQMGSSVKTQSNEEVSVQKITLRETDLLSDSSITEDTTENTVKPCDTEVGFAFVKAGQRKRIIAMIAFNVKKIISATISADNSFDIDIEAEPEFYNIFIRIIDEQIDFTSLTILSDEEDVEEISFRQNQSRNYATDRSKSDDLQPRTGITVSIVARSVHDNIYASLEEIPWGEVQMSLPEADTPLMYQSVEDESRVNSVQFNVTVSESTQDERKSLPSQPSLKESQTSLTEDGNTLSTMSINIPSYVIKLGSTATITCELNNYLPQNSHIEWYRGNDELERIPGKLDRISHDLLEVLIITNVDMQDNDLYSLKVNNEMFPVAYLAVDEHPDTTAYILTPPQTQFVMEGQPTVISCLVSQLGENVHWMKDRRPFDPLGDRIRLDTTPDGYHRILFTDTKCSDQGTYVAVLGEQCVPITLVVEERIDEKEVTVVASGTESEDEDVQEYLVPPGSTATIACELEQGQERRELSWMKDGQTMTFENPSKAEHVVNGLKHYLVIHDTQPDDSGLYSVCIANTEFRVAHLAVDNMTTSLMGLKRKRISNSSLH